MSLSRPVSFLLATVSRQSLPWSLRRIPAIARPPIRRLAVRRFYSSEQTTSPSTSTTKHSSLSYPSPSSQHPEASEKRAWQGGQNTAGSQSEKPKAPAYRLTFTCKVCEHRSSHEVSKQGYHKGSVLITCPGCHNRHVISDHLRIFSEKDAGATIEEILARKGQLVKKGTLGEDGDVEFWEDVTVVGRQDSEATASQVIGSDSAAKTARDSGEELASKSVPTASEDSDRTSQPTSPCTDRYAAHEKLKEYEQSSSTGV